MWTSGINQLSGGLPVGDPGPTLSGLAPEAKIRNETPLLMAFWLLTLGAFAALLVVDPTMAGSRVGARGEKSMIRPANFARALDEVRSRAPGGTVSMLRLEPDGARFFIDGARNGTSMILVEAGGDVDTFGAGTGRPTTGGIDVGRIDELAPTRMLDALRRRRGSDKFDYLVLMRFGEAGRWSVFVDGEQALTADADGRAAGTPQERVRREQKRMRRKIARPPGTGDVRRRQRRFQRCVQRSLRRGQDGSACTDILTKGIR